MPQEVLHTKDMFHFYQCVCLQTENKRYKKEPEIAYHINRGALVFKRNVPVLQTLHGDRQTDTQRERKPVRQVVLLFFPFLRSDPK